MEFPHLCQGGRRGDHQRERLAFAFGDRGHFALYSPLLAGYLFSVEDAIHFSLGQRFGISSENLSSAKGASHRTLTSLKLNRAFSAWICKGYFLWGVVPGRGMITCLQR